MVMMRSSSGMNDDSTFSVVVLPAPVPPETRMLSRPRTHCSRKSATARVIVPKPIRSSTWYGSAANLRIVSSEPSMASGGMIGVDPAAVGQAGVDHRAGLVDAAADPGDDLVDGAAQVRLVGERARRPGRCRPPRST